VALMAGLLNHWTGMDWNLKFVVFDEDDVITRSG